MSTETTETRRRRRWSVRSALSLTAAAISALLVLAMVTLTALSDRKIDFGGDINTEINAAIELPEATFTIVCLPTFHGFDQEAAGISDYATTGGAQIRAITALDGDGKSLGEGQEGQLQGQAGIAFEVAAPPGGQLGALSTVDVARDELAGVAPSPCQRTTTDGWFAAGATTIEQSATLVAANPYERATQLHLRAWTESGPVDTEPVVAIEARSVKDINLATYFPDAERLLVHAVAVGPGVAMNLQLAANEGLAPQGIAASAPLRQGATDFTFAGVEANAKTYLRLANPGEEDAHASVFVHDEEGRGALAGAEDLVVDAGAVFDVSLDEAGKGRIGISVSADQALMSSIVTVTDVAENPEGGMRRAITVWEPAQLATTLGAYLPASLGKKASVYLVNPGPRPLEVTVGDQSVQLAPYGSASAEVSGPQVSIAAPSPVAAVVGVDLASKTQKQVTLPTGDLRQSRPHTQVQVYQ